MLSILVIEDSPEKIGSINDIINNFSEEIEFNVAHDIQEALNKLSSDYYDLLLLDLFIPFSWGQNSSPQNAINLVQQLSQDEDLKYPLSILAITKADDIEENYLNVLEQHTISLLQYKENSDIWKHQLKNRLQALISTKRNLYYRLGYNYDVAVINALQEPEHSQLKTVFGCQWNRISFDNDDFNNYYEGIINNKNGRKIRCISTYANQMASIASSALTTKIIYNFRPRYLFMTGIAAGIDSGKMNYGDILVASEIHDGASGKIRTNVEDGGSIFEPDIRQKILKADFTTIITRLQSDRAVLDNIANNYPTKIGKPSTQLAIHLGPMASVPAVISNMDEINKLKTPVRKLQGIEMESYGVFYAAENAIKPLPEIVASLKSISDFADSKKNDNYQEYASYTSAALLKYIIENELTF